MRNTHRAYLFAFSLSVAALAAAPTAFAGEAESRTLFAEGRKLREEKKCAEAVVVFRKALDTYPDGLGSLRNIAECEQEIGWLASSRRDWSDLRVAVLQSNSPKYEGWDATADAAYKALETRVARVTLKISGEDPVEELRIQMNGKPFDPRLVGTELEQDLGKLRIEVFYGGKQPVVKEVDVQEGTRGTIEIKVPKVVKAPVDAGVKGPSADELAAQESRRKTRKNMHIGGAVALGVGGAGLVGLGVSIGVRQNAVSGVDGLCPGRKNCKDSPRLQSNIDIGKTASTLVNVFAVTAGVGVATGVILFAAAPSDGASPKKTGIDFQIAPTAGGAYFGATGFF